ncbi:MAG TPA: RNA-binding protein [Chitinophagaceae bacterium]
MNLYVSNLDYSIQDDGLKKMFANYGTVGSAKVILDRTTGKSRGFGFVEMPDKDEATKAISALDGSMSDGKQIKVSEARPKSY